jgi:hypothetical protein
MQSNMHMPISRKSDFQTDPQPEISDTGKPPLLFNAHDYDP